VKRAVIYLRVSSSGQLTDRAPDGLSITAQREACHHKAAELGAEVVEEYTDKAESAKFADRPGLQAMLGRIKAQRDVDYVILFKVNRLARNRRDDANLMFELWQYGARLVSVAENIDDTPAGQLLHAILAGVAEFESRNLAAEVLKGLTQKAKIGGTPGRAPLGYENVREKIAGREVRTIALDPDRAPLITWAFTAYATGNYSLERLLRELTERGLTSRDSRNFGRPIKRSALASLLKSPYYVGVVRYRGVEYEGRHQPLIDKETFSRVQQILKAHEAAGEKDRKHHHYLKGTVYCARCHSRLLITRANGHGGTYLYYFCAGRQRRNGCEQRYVQVPTVEEAVIRDAYGPLSLTASEVARIRERFAIYLAGRDKAAERETKRQRRRIAKLRAEREKLLHAYYAGALPVELLKTEQDRIARELATAEGKLAEHELEAAAVRETLEQALALALDCQANYQRASKPLRRQWNQVFFRRLLVLDDRVVATERADGIDEIYELRDRLAAEAAQPEAAPSHGPGSSEAVLVEPAGLEPATFALPARRSSS
jgi:site-specific DNA recombinase